MTTTGTREPNTGDIPVPSWVNRGENKTPDTPDEEVDSARPGINWGAWALVALAMVVATLSITLFIATRGDDGETQRADLRNRALDGLTGRFNDASINPKVNITRLEWVGDQMMIDYSQGKERCTSIVIVPKQPGQLFDIVPVGDTDPSKWGPNVPHCFTISNSDPLP